MSTFNWVFILTLTLFISRRISCNSILSSDQSNQQQLDRVLKLPGQNFNVSFAHYAGYVNVNKESGRSLFYWFFEAEEDPSSKPIILWLNGGPGCSSIAYGLAEEIGPFHIEKDGKTLYLNPYSWNKAANILFLDSPVGVGYSYSNTSSDLLSNGDKRTAAENLEFLLKWFKRFPEYKGRDFYISGESYAGHYVPQLSQAIVRHNQKNGEKLINLKGFMVGNALIDDFHDHLGLFQYMWAVGMISDQTFKQLNIVCDFQSFIHVSERCEKALEIADEEVGDIDMYSIFTPPCSGNFSRLNRLWRRRKSRTGLLRRSYDPCTEKHSTVYFNLPEVQRALHVHTTNSPLKWETCSDTVNENWNDSPRSVLNIFRELIHAGLRIWIFRKAGGGSSNKPPGPPGWPLIGNILDVGMMPHQSTHKLKVKYGPVLWLKLGMSNALVVQSAKTAEELFKKHDLQFSDRKVLHSFTACDHDKGSFAVARYGDYWRMIRKLCATDLLSQKRINGAAATRQNCVDVMMQWIRDREDSAKGSSGEIQLEKYLVLMTFDVLCKFVISKDIMGTNSEIGHEFHEAMTKYLQWSGTPNLVDSFPFLKPFDPQGIKRNAEKYLTKLIDMVGGFVKERVEEKLSGKHKETKDFLDALLENDGKGDQLSEKSVILVILEMFFAGTETTSSTIEWGMAELLHNPDSLRKLKDELDLVIGHSRKVEEGDLNKLPYLQAVVKETMRLHPTVPFLLPRNSMEDTNFMGYFIPKDTMVLVNAWSIQRDPDSWEDPLTFKPERFIDSKIDSKGQNFELIPFGSGRRSCIGMLMGEKMVTLTLGRLIHEFDWKLPPNVTPQTMDMREKLGITLNLLDPFKAIPVQRNYF